MISGPVIPRNRGGLWELLQRHLEGVERGLRVLASDLDLEAECRVDALAADAAGRPVLVFLIADEAPPAALARLLGAVAWWRGGADFLAGALPFEGLDYGAEPRLLLAGFAFPPDLLDQLRLLESLEIEVCRVRALRVDGRPITGVQRLLGTVAPGAEDSFRAPAGVRDPKLRALCAQLLGTLEGVDASLSVTGDRYSRRITCDGRMLAVVALDGPGLRVTIGGGDEAAQLAVGTPEQGREAADRIMRAYLSATAECGAESIEREGGANGAGSFERLGRALEQSQLSPEEFISLGGSGPGGD